MPKKRTTVASFTEKDELRLLKALDKVAKARRTSRNKLVASIIKQFLKYNAQI